MQDSKTRKRIIVISSGFFLAFVLYVYRAYDIPQGISLSGHSLLFRTCLLGLATSLMFYLNEFHVKRFFKTPPDPRKSLYFKLEFMGIVDRSHGYGMVVHDGGNYPFGKISYTGRYLIHEGATEGYKSMLTVAEGGKWIVTHLSNIGDRTNELMLTDKIFQILTHSGHEN